MRTFVLYLLLSPILILVAVEPAPVLATGGVPPRIDLSAYTMTFQDEFEGPALDTAKWDTPTQERWKGCRWTPSLVSVQNGYLRLGVRLTDHPQLRYACGAVRTRRNYDKNQTLFAQKFGYFEARCKLPRRLDADYFADFWIMAGSIGEGNNTRAGSEIDIFESFELAEGNHYSFNLHWGGYGKTHNTYGLKCGDQPHLRDNQFHVYGFLWTQDFYVVYVDGVEIGRTDVMGLGSDQDGRMKSNGPCQEEGYLKLTVEAAAWPGKSSGWEANPPQEDEFLIDWVRAYLPTASLPPAADPAKGR